MIKIVLLILVIISNVFAGDKRAIVNLHINGEEKIAEVTYPKAYYFKCIDGYKWIQFVRVASQGDINTAAEVREEGLPIQMFRESSLSKTSNVPVGC